MTELIDKLRAALDERERTIEGSGVLGWLTYRNADGSMKYATAASHLGDECWVVDGIEATGWANARVIHDEDRERRQVAAHRKILEIHDQGGHGQCIGCNWTAQQDYWTDDVNSCPTLLALAGAYNVQV